MTDIFTRHDYILFVDQSMTLMYIIMPNCISKRDRLQVFTEYTPCLPPWDTCL